MPCPYRTKALTRATTATAAAGIHRLACIFSAPPAAVSIISLKLPSTMGSLPRTWSTTQETILGLMRSRSAIPAESSIDMIKKERLPFSANFINDAFVGNLSPVLFFMFFLSCKY